MRRHVAAAVLSIGSVAALSAQTAAQLLQPFSDAVRAYQRQDIAESLGVLISWPRRDLERVIPPVVATREWPLVEAAAMVHTELALAQFEEGRRTDVDGYLSLAEALVQRLPSVEGARFRAHWYACAASIFLLHTSPDPARVLVDKGLRVAASDARLHMLSGEVAEMMAHVENPECNGPGCDSRGPRSQASLRFLNAANEYRRALELDSQLIGARLRLGRVLYYQGQRSRARAELTVVRQQATDRNLVYLSHLFLAALDQDEHDLSSARREYEAAMTLAPEFQTAPIALSFLQLITGSTAGARETMQTAVARLRTADDPWWTYQNGGIDVEALEWLRARVRR